MAINLFFNYIFSAYFCLGFFNPLYGFPLSQEITGNFHAPPQSCYLMGGTNPLPLPPKNRYRWLYTPGGKARATSPASSEWCCSCFSKISRSFFSSFILFFSMYFAYRSCSFSNAFLASSLWEIIKFWQAFQTFSFMNLLKVLNNQLGLPVLESINMHL